MFLKGSKTKKYTPEKTEINERKLESALAMSIFVYVQRKSASIAESTLLALENLKIEAD